MSQTKVYYNSACPVCKAGIDYQRRKLGDAGATIDWIDVHANNEAACEVSTDLELVRERLHVVDEAGRLHIGADAFALLWSRTPGQKTLARVTRYPALHGLWRRLYDAFAALLYRWNRRNGRW